MVTMEQSINLEEGQPEFSEEELDSMRVGEELQEQQEQMLAGKFKVLKSLRKHTSNCNETRI